MIFLDRIGMNMMRWFKMQLVTALLLLNAYTYIQVFARNIKYNITRLSWSKFLGLNGRPFGLQMVFYSYTININNKVQNYKGTFISAIRITQIKIREILKGED